METLHHPATLLRVAVSYFSMAAPQTVPAIDYRPPSIFREAYGFYSEHFGLVVKLMAGPIAIALGAAWMMREGTALIFQEFRSGVLTSRTQALLEASALNQLRYFAHWLCYCFAFVGICYSVQELREGQEPRPADCTNVVREKSRRFLASSLGLYLIVGSGLLLVILLASNIFIIQVRFKIHLFQNEVTWMTYLLLALVTPVLVRFAFTVPVAVMEDLPLIAALKRADRLSDWRILALTRLVIESEAAGFVAGYFAYRVVGAAGWRGGPGLPFYLAIALGGFAQAPMLIGMAVLLCQAKEDPRVSASRQLPA